ncbi:intracellular septation protein A [Methylophilaceae bacterium 11]|jgi:intracellular septation protein|uniref:septation protein A n=1 Tax=unclassified Methylotenera TaxID=2643294 RepID=UPI0003649741|nr:MULTISPECIES: septation protein A [unclassified Methylotenera]EUJ09970.1 intracellular septation protein A [Methylophilaceae bacterium 11]
MKIFFDLLPVILFFVAYKLFDIYVATAVAIGTTIALILWSKLVFKTVDKALLINGAIISILGGITLLLHDKTYIMWKPTALYWIGALVLFVSNQFFNKNLIQQMMHKVLNPPATVWHKLNWVWILFLVVLGILNLYVAFHFTENAWVNFKLFGVTSLMFAFMIGQTLVLKAYLVNPNHEDPNQKDGE